VRWISRAARIRKPASSILVTTRPTTPFWTASGLMMVRVRSSAIVVLSRWGERSAPASDHAGDRGAHVGRALHGGDAGSLHRAHLLGRRALAARDDGAGVPHAAPWRRRLSADEAHDGLGDVGPDERRRFLLGGAADLADQHDRLGAGIVLEEAEDVDEARPVHRIPADADAGGLAEAALRELVDDLVGQRAAARHDPHPALLMDVAGHDADLRLAGRDQAGAVRAEQPRRA